LQNLAIDHPERVRCAVFSNTWVKADEYITRVQMTRKRVALSYGPDEYVKLSTLFTNGPMQFRHDLGKVMALERRALQTVAPVDILAQRLDMTLTHDRSADLVPSYQSEDLHQGIAGSRLVILEEGGHYSYRRHWQEWNRVVDRFLREAEAGGA
jgi:pimeloyl-ACP methyl ester carboxylesterase